MDNMIITVLLALAGVAAGFGVAYLWSRSLPAHEQRRTAELEAQLAAVREQALRYGVQSAELEREANQLRGQLLEAVQRSATLEERARNADELRGLIREREQAIARLTEEASRARERAAELGTRLEEERQQSQEKLKLVVEAQRALENSFKSLSADALKSNNQSFLDLAKASLAEFQQGAKGDLEKRQIGIEWLVRPVRESRDKVDEKTGALEKGREHAYGEIRQQFTNMAEVQTQLRDETTNLVKALRQPHVRGRWGEIQLPRVVEMAGAEADRHFLRQRSGVRPGRKPRPHLS